MHETIQQVLTHVRMVWHFRWVGLVIASIVCVGGWAFVIWMPDQYKAETKVFIDTRTMLKPLLRGLAIDANMSDSTDIISRTLLARPNLEQIARKTDLDLSAKSPEAFDALLVRLAKQIKVDKTRRESIFVISYTNPDPTLATRVVESVLNLFVERALGDSRKDSTKSARFLQDQIKEYEARLIAAENRLKEFKRKNMGLLPGSSGGYFSQLEAQRDQIQVAELELKEAQLRRQELANQLDDVDQMLEQPEWMSAPTAALGHPLDARIANLEQTLDELLIKYTERHPDVIYTQSQLDRLKKERSAEVVAREEPESVGGPGSGSKARQVENPMYQQLTIALSESQAVVAALNARVEEYRAREEALGRLVDQALAVEAEFSRLNRDYDVDRNNHSELLKRREQLDMSEDMSQSTDSLTFNIIEPPRKPVTPNSPNRPALDAAVLAIGLGGGIAFAWVVGMVRPTIFAKEDLADFTDLPVIGVVHRIWTPRERFRRRLEVTTFGFACTGLFVLFVGLVLIDGLNLPLVQRAVAIGRSLL